MEHQDHEMKTFFQSNTAKMMMVGFLTLVLLIPLFFVQDLITERSQRKQEVITETTSKWGGEVFCYGPMLKVPYYDNTTKQLQTAYFFPDKLTTASEVKMARTLKRSIYKANV
ncbi:inner membrane CreD family protein, partial [Flavobacterium sp.]|uniref:inner membrane CreD family protein n=1 Tax=Flavobacterium sp. TaxID=239 RepID=UPI00391953B4